MRFTEAHLRERIHENKHTVSSMDFKFIWQINTLKRLRIYIHMRACI